MQRRDMHSIPGQFYGESPDSPNGPWLNTKMFAAALGLEPQSIRKRHSQTGSYFGVRCAKLPNGRLCWPAAAIEILLGRAGQ